MSENIITFNEYEFYIVFTNVENINKLKNLHKNMKKNFINIQYDKISKENERLQYLIDYVIMNKIRRLDISKYHGLYIISENSKIFDRISDKIKKAISQKDDRILEVINLQKHY